MLKKILNLEIDIYWTYVQLVVRNRWLSPQQAGSIKLFGYIFDYPKRGSLHGMFKEIFLKKNYETESTQAPLKIIDCGANIGLSVLYFSLRAPNATITVYEPNPHTFKILKRNIERNKFNATLVNAGVAKNTEEVTFYTDSEDMSSQSASVTKHLDTKNRPLVPLQVKMEQLSMSINEPIDILKLDIEGAEGEVIEDLAHNGKLGLIKKIFIEYHYDGTNTVYPLGKMLNYLDESGFRYVIETGIKFPYTLPKRATNLSYKLIAWRE